MLKLVDEPKLSELEMRLSDLRTILQSLEKRRQHQLTVRTSVTVFLTEAAINALFMDEHCEGQVFELFKELDDEIDRKIADITKEIRGIERAINRR